MTSGAGRWIMLDAQKKIVRRKLTSSEENPMALALKTKPHTNRGCFFQQERVCTLGEDAFELAPAMTKEIH